MAETGEIRTAAIKACEHCAAGILDRDRFCRWCGALQGAKTSDFSPAPRPLPLGVREQSRYLTKGLGQLESTGSLHRVSGPLVSAVVTTLATGPATRPRRSLFAAAVAALLSIPLWLMIVLLSPLDAYAAARNLSRGL